MSDLTKLAVEFADTWEKGGPRALEAAEDLIRDEDLGTILVEALLRVSRSPMVQADEAIEVLQSAATAGDDRALQALEAIRTDLDQYLYFAALEGDHE